MSLVPRAGVRANARVRVDALAVAVMVVVAAMCHNFYFLQCLLQWMGVRSGG